MAVERHEHTGEDSPKIDPRYLKGFPIFDSTPTHKAEEGTIVVSGSSLYVMIDGTWSAVGGGKASVRVKLSSAQDVDTGTQTTVEFDTESWDSGGDFDTSTYKFTAPRDGYYVVQTKIKLRTSAVGDQCQVYIIKNTSTHSISVSYATFAGFNDYWAYDVVNCSANDTINIDVKHDSGVTRDIAATTSTWLNINEL